MRTDVRMGDASMAGNYDFLMAEFLIIRGQRYGGGSREGIIEALRLPEREPVASYVFPDEDCKICSSGEEERVYETGGCCSFGFFIDPLVIRNVFMRGNPEEGDRRRSGLGSLTLGGPLKCWHVISGDLDTVQRFIQLPP